MTERRGLEQMIVHECQITAIFIFLFPFSPKKAIGTNFRANAFLMGCFGWVTGKKGGKLIEIMRFPYLSSFLDSSFFEVF